MVYAKSNRYDAWKTSTNKLYLPRTFPNDHGTGGGSMRKPDFIIGSKEDPYIKRWWVIPRNKIFNIYLHNILRPDDDRALHDHPWWNLSIILKGSYIEITPKGSFLRKQWSIVGRKATALHRLVPMGDCWTLFITGPVIREWGFACPNGWTPWHKFTTKTSDNSIGQGCGD